MFHVVDCRLTRGGQSVDGVDGRRCMSCAPLRRRSGGGW